MGYGGGRGGGKSFTVCNEGVRQSVAYPGNLGAIVRRDLVDLTDTTMDVMKRYVIPEYEKEGMEFEWKGGNRPQLEIKIGDTVSTILWRDAKDEVSLMSANLGWIGIDESVELDEKFY